MPCSKIEFLLLPVSVEQACEEERQSLESHVWAINTIANGMVLAQYLFGGKKGHWSLSLPKDLTLGISLEIAVQNCWQVALPCVKRTLQSQHLVAG
jgi:hypothetical protein